MSLPPVVAKEDWKFWIKTYLSSNLPASSDQVFSDVKVITFLQLIPIFTQFIRRSKEAVYVNVLHAVHGCRFIWLCVQIKNLKLSYLKSFWNILDIVVILMATCCIIFNIYRTVEVNNILEKLLANPDQYSNFETLSYWEMVFNSTMAIMVFFAWVKVGHLTHCYA